MLLALLQLGAVLGCCSSVAAEQTDRAAKPYSLSWRAPNACPSAARVDEAIRALLEGSQARPSKTVRAQADVSEEAPGRWLLELELVSAAGTHERTVEGANCVSLALAAALVVAIAIDPLVPADSQQAEKILKKLQTEETQPETAPQPARPTLHPSPKREAAAPPVGEEAGWQPVLVLGVDAGSGLMPRLAAAASVGVLLELKAFRIGLELQGSLPQTRGLDALPSAEVHYLYMGAVPSACWQLRAGDWFFPACATGTIGFLRGRAEGISDPRTGWDHFVAAGSSLAVLYRFGALRVGPSVAGRVTFKRARFHVDNVGQAWSTRRLLLQAGLRLEWGGARRLR